ncbi:MAG: glycosyltransferase family 2 protein [Cytophagia bacterium]|nr:glycosyltransferase family 2 protein [Cytophagia bacterium]
MAELTILMPAFNASPYLKEAIESLMYQSYTDFELWLIDDGSTDDTLIIAQTLATQDSRIVIFKNASNQGKLSSINTRVRAVKSTFFTITDADDVSHPQRLEKQIAKLKSDTALMMCGTSYAAMDTDGYIIRAVHVSSDLNALRARSLVQSAFMGGTMVMRTELLNDFPELYRPYFNNCMEDSDLGCRILDKYAATNLDELLYFYRIVPTSLTRGRVTPRSLNIYKLIGELSKQRRILGKDCLELGEVTIADDFMMKIEQAYSQDVILWLHHQSFFYLYWGQHDVAFSTILKAVAHKPYHIKTVVVFLLISMRIALFYLRSAFKKVHYLALFK